MAGRHRYHRLPTSASSSTSSDVDVPNMGIRDANTEETTSKVALEEEPDIHTRTTTWRDKKWWKRDHYPGALLFNIATFLLPAIYGTLSKLYVANIDSSLVATTDTYTYIGTVVEVINEGLPRAAYKVIGDKNRRTVPQRFRLATGLLCFQTLLGLIMSLIIFGAAEEFTAAFVPKETKKESIQYVRIAAFSSLFSAADVAVGVATRTLDRPDVPLVISSVRTLVNIVLDVIFLSKYRVGKDVEVNTQAVIRLCCDAAGALAGVGYFLWIAKRVGGEALKRPDWKGLMTLMKPGSFTFTESAIRNALYLWLVSGIVGLGKDYATAWGVFNTIRWGIVMVPVYALESTSNTFTGHRWGHFRSKLLPRASTRDILYITHPALLSLLLSLIVEIPLCLGMSFAGAYSFAYYLSNSHRVAEITRYMWRTIDWCYIFYAVTTQLASVLLATKPKWFLVQSAVTNLVYVLPWAVAMQVKEGNLGGDPWKWYALVFGGSMVVSFVVVSGVLGIWVWRGRRNAWGVGSWGMGGMWRSGGGESVRAD